MAPELDSMLTLEEDVTDPPAEPADPPAAGGNSDPSKLEKQVSELVESNKNLQEQLRQNTENNKTLADFRDKMVNVFDNSDDDAQKKAQEMLLKFDENPVEFIKDFSKKAIEEQVTPLVDRLEVLNSSSVVKEVMNQVDKNYLVDWNKDHKKINAQLKNFSADAIKGNPKGTLLSACKLAGVIKPRENPASPTTMEAATRSGGLPRPASKSHSDKVNENLDKIGKKGKATNVFKL